MCQLIEMINLRYMIEVQSGYCRCMCCTLTFMPKLIGECCRCIILCVFVMKNAPDQQDIFMKTGCMTSITADLAMTADRAMTADSSVTVVTARKFVL
jgi:hypothetical protein